MTILTCLMSENCGGGWDTGSEDDVDEEEEDRYGV